MAGMGLSAQGGGIVPGTSPLLLFREAGIQRNFLTFWLPTPHIAIMETRFYRDQRGGFYEDRGQFRADRKSNHEFACI